MLISLVESSGIRIENADAMRFFAPCHKSLIFASYPGWRFIRRISITLLHGRTTALLTNKNNRHIFKAQFYNSKNQRSRIVFVSNYTDERTRQWAEGAGRAAFFGKDDLLSLLEFLKKEKHENLRRRI